MSAASAGEAAGGFVPLWRAAPPLRAPVEPIAVDVDAIAELLDLSPRTVREWRELPRVEVGRRVLYPVQACREFVNAEATRRR